MPLFIPILEGMVTRLETNSYFADIPVIAQGVGTDAATHIEKRVRTNITKAGINVELAITKMVPEALDAHGPYFSPIQILARIIENPAINLAAGGTGKPALDVVERVSNLLHLHTDTTIGLTHHMDPAGGTPVPDDQFHIWDIPFIAHGGLTTS